MSINLLLSFAAGFLSFVSPCCLPLYPAFLSYITGVSVEELKVKNGMMQKRAILHTAFFLLGFSIIFLALGFSATAIGHLFLSHSDVIRQIGAITVFILGLILLGVFKPKFLMRNHTVELRSRPSGYIGSIVIGMGFAAGWTPCTGPILAGVIALSISNPNAGMGYMLAYVLGFSVPFFLMAFFIGKVQFVKKYNRVMMKVGGYGMIVMGVFLYMDWMTKIIAFLTERFFNGFTGF
ncbi:cytochrome C biogenesis protein CcdA [Planococcus lenghuensis]|uniref:Cytochrome C biogenesis protein CcdA n=2 Tax=Planococcus lenghuensis TaxID=2213202 RepID=A0A1Q2KZM0_9BACL|nr:cytochrome C biogenesis protein CcdA [Planococcus lenghuensis]